MFMRPLVAGVIFWLAGTAALRVWGAYLLRPQQPLSTVLLYLASAAAMAAFVPWLTGKLQFHGADRVRASALVALPTLLLDPFSCIFFDTLFPNMDAAVAGQFGGLMLICCGGALAGACLARNSR